MPLRFRRWTRYSGYQSTQKTLLPKKIKRRIRRRKTIKIFGKRYRLRLRKRPWWVWKFKCSSWEFKSQKVSLKKIKKNKIQ
jgi:hypothetical protein